jgi:hypothetical protein
VLQTLLHGLGMDVAAVAALSVRVAGVVALAWHECCSCCSSKCACCRRCCTGLA